MLNFVGVWIGRFARFPGLFGAVLVALFFQGAYQIGSALLLKYVFDEGITQGQTDALLYALGGMTALLGVHALGTFGQEFFLTRLCLGVVNLRRHDIFEKVQQLPPSHFGDGSSGATTALFSTDMSAVETALVRGVAPFLLQTAIIIASVLLLFAIEWRLALITLAAMPPIFLLPRAFGKAAKAWNERYAEAAAGALSMAQESVATHAIVRLFGLGRDRLERFARTLAALEPAGIRAHMFAGLVGRTAFIGTGLSQVVVIGAGAWLAIEGYMTAGLLVAFASLLLRISDAVAQLTNAVPLILPASSAERRIAAFLATPLPALEAPDAVPVAALNGRIVFEHVSFGYDAEHLILHDVSLAIAPGERIAFVGPSGSGKSTIIALLLRLYRPQSGRIVIDGRPLETIAEASLRANMSVVPQNPILFDASARDNILCARPQASEAEVIAAAQAAFIHDTLIAKPEGYDLRVSAAGGQLSGGERQRLATARAFLRDAPILLLDEATSALDPASEEAINRAVAGLARRRTVIAVTHRLGALVDYDRIFVLKAGVLVEAGTHRELIAQNGLYCWLWTKQQGISLDIDAGAPSITAERLAAIPFLAGCEPKTLADLARYFVVERFREGDFVFRQGDAGDKFYVVAHGRLDVRQSAPSGAETVLATLVDGDFFGELALVKNQPRAAAIRAVTDSWCLALPRQHFVTLLQAEPSVHANIMAAITRIQSEAAVA